ncbi:cytochrome C oxidase Cbb3, partial [Pseudomonas stutzeri]|nr:cytochrome C oxidase Cbb3 [Stutzerimonas stutzeri]
ASHPGYLVRLAGGGLFAFGMLLMAYNTWRTVRAGEHAVQAPIPHLASAR